jgi:hypothetical protein
VIAEALAESGRIDEAIEAAAIERRNDRSALLAGIAKARAAAGQIGAALKVAQDIPEARTRPGRRAVVDRRGTDQGGPQD